MLQGNMFEKPGDPMCPVQSLVKFMSISQKPKPFSPENAATQPIWYTCKPLGKNTTQINRKDTVVHNSVINWIQTTPCLKTSQSNCQPCFSPFRTSQSTPCQLE
ncbi:UNVERIFIED_CONTAM: hypothetical protein FKN15_037753 [Acipenser sinensis]